MTEADDYDSDGKVRLADWCPPWLDNGERLGQMVEHLRELNDASCWRIIAVLLSAQLEADLALERAVNAARRN